MNNFKKFFKWFLHLFKRKSRIYGKDSPMVNPNHVAQVEKYRQQLIKSAEWRAKRGYTLIWDSHKQGTYVRALHGEIGTKRKIA